MKALFLWILILSMAVEFPVTPVAIAKTNKADKAVATQQPDKLRTQIRRNPGAEDHSVTVIAQKTRKSVSIDTRIKKNSSSINGTTIHRKH